MKEIVIEKPKEITLEIENMKIDITIITIEIGIIEIVTEIEITEIEIVIEETEITIEIVIMTQEIEIRDTELIPIVMERILETLQSLDRFPPILDKLDSLRLVHQLKDFHPINQLQMQHHLLLLLPLQLRTFPNCF